MAIFEDFIMAANKALTYREYKNLAELKLVDVLDTDLWRAEFGLEKRTEHKWEQIPETHANDAAAMLMGTTGCAGGAPAFFVWRALRFVRRSLHRQNPQKGGVRPRFGGTANSAFLRKGDWVEVSTQKGTFRGWVSGLPTSRTPRAAVVDTEGKRIGQFSPAGVRLLARSGGFTWKKGGSATSSPGLKAGDSVAQGC